jgi:aryl-alcohol dehydrogenase-like predicted oxidoreductase
MEYTHLGRSGVTVSRLCLGTLNFGPETPEPDAHAIMDHAHEQGINFFDTANVYGGKFGEGVTEQIIGRWVAQGGGRRERTFLSAKVCSPMGEWPNDKGLSAFNIRQACDASLKRLQTDHIDLYQMHHPDPNTSWDEVWEAMSHLRAQGKILYVGSSNFAGWNIAAAQDAALARQLLGLVSEQSIYNLATRNIEAEVIPAARHYGLGVLAWSPLYRGLLTGVLRDPRQASRYKTGHLDAHREQLKRFESLCDELGHPPAEVALAWLLSRPGLTAPVLGPRTAAELDSAVQAMEITLDAPTLERLDEIFPGYPPAPEGYIS